MGWGGGSGWGGGGQEKGGRGLEGFRPDRPVRVGCTRFALPLYANLFLNKVRASITATRDDLGEALLKKRNRCLGKDSPEKRSRGSKM